jgi:hypothetical protein
MAWWRSSLIFSLLRAQSGVEGWFGNGGDGTGCTAGVEIVAQVVAHSAESQAGGEKALVKPDEVTVGFQVRSRNNLHA